MLKDRFGRRIDYLRLSVTDRCNLRCHYCLPETYSDFSPAADMLTDAEILRLAGCFTSLGVRAIRVTGGEPLTRPGLPALIHGLASLPGVDDLSLSTNGVLLAPLAQALKDAGLKRVNISLDTLDADRFKTITRFGDLGKVRQSIDAALAVGFDPIKLNVVVIRGTNDDEIDAFATLTQTRPIQVRFIELMPMGETGYFSKERLLPLDAIMRLAGPLEPLPHDDWPIGHGPARYHKRPGAKGAIGTISALSCGFCDTCNRLRLTAKGMLTPCLDGNEGTDLKTPLRQGADDDTLKDLIRHTVAIKPERHHMVERAQASTPNPRFMCQTGG
ncbi:MAG: GTP 3',8-cyclase MoaA [Elusimicrobiota bacterium]